MTPPARSALRLPAVWWTGGLLLAGLIGLLSLAPVSQLPRVRIWDKLEHAAAYVALSLWFAALLTRRQWALLLASLLLYGALIEIAQGAMGMGRTADFRDFIANLLGALIGLGLATTPLGRWPAMIESLLGLRRGAA
jgi:VanZ family protein